MVDAASPHQRPAPAGRQRRRLVGAVLVRWIIILTAVTGLMYLARARLDKAHIALGFLLVVLGGSAAGGRGVGVPLAALAFLSFNFLFLPPYYALTIANPLDWLVLVAFLATGIVAAHLLDRAQERAEIARQRTAEVERLAALGAETLNAGRAEEAVQRIAEVIRSTLATECCEVLVPSRRPGELLTLTRGGRCNDDAGSDVTAPWNLVAWVAEKHAVAAERADGTKWVGEGDDTRGRQWPPEGTRIRTLIVPLTVRNRTVGVLRITHPTAFTLDPSREQFLSALAYYAALGVERLRLVADAERAEALRQADALKDALIAGVSHDLRTPLTTIKALAHGLREQGIGEGGSIEDEADRLNRLVTDLLDLSRLNAGAMPMHLEINAADDLVGAAMKQVAGAVGARRFVVTARGTFPADAVSLGRFDFVQSLRALVNLIENAHKYSPPDESIELTIEPIGTELRIHVADRGPGIAASDAARVFEPFYRVSGAPPDVGGAGLGLSIAQRLAREQGGDVRYAPRERGGSIFTLVLRGERDGVLA
jgi:two-component system sensor histidine kinase KdpD